MSDYIERYWRDATPADAIKEPPMVARFRDDDGGEWKWNGRLLGIDRSVISGCLWCAKNAAFRYCQVYDAPDPGEGWRLVDVENEKPQAGDEFKCASEWVYCNEFLRDTFYASNQVIRRRIEQPKPEPRYEPFRWEDREQLRGRWIVDRTGEQEYTIDDFLNDDGVLYICGHPAEHFLNWRFLDTGEPVGRRVE